MGCRCFVGGGFFFRRLGCRCFVGGGFFFRRFGRRCFLGSGFFFRRLGCGCFVGGGFFFRCLGGRCLVGGGFFFRRLGRRCFVGGGFGLFFGLFGSAFFGSGFFGGRARFFVGSGFGGGGFARFSVCLFFGGFDFLRGAFFGGLSGSGILGGFFACRPGGFFGSFSGGLFPFLSRGFCLPRGFGTAGGFFGPALLFFGGAARGFFFPPSRFFGLSFGFEAGAFFGLLSGGDVVEGVLQGARVHDLRGDGFGIRVLRRRSFAAVDFDGVFASEQEDEGEGDDADAYARDAAQVFLQDDALRLAAFSHGFPPLSGGCSVTRPTFLAPPCCRRTMPSMTRL